MSELRLALRALAKSPGFTTVAILTLAVGIGATTAMFSALEALVIHPFSYPESDRIVHVWSGDRWPLSEPDFLDLKEQSQSFVEFGCYAPQTANLGGENPRSIHAAVATSGVLESFGVPPLRGRLLEPEDDKDGSPQVVVISHALWQQSFAGDPELVGKTIRINAQDVPVIGIMPPEFEFASPWMRTATCEAWMPFRPRADNGIRGNHGQLGIARLGEGVSVAAADAEIKAIGRRLAETYPDTNTRKEFLVRSLHDEMTRDIGARIWMLFGAVALVLMVACANVASMLLARSSRRQGEFGVRIALGAGSGDIARLALAESLVLALAAGAFGLLLAKGGVEVLRLIAPVSASRRGAMDLDLRVVGFTIGLAVVATLLAGLPPALAAARTSVAGMLRDIGGRGCAGSRTRHRFLRGLVIAQIALALMLANGAAVFSTAYLKLLEANEALANESVVAVEISLRGEHYGEVDARVQLWDRLVERAAVLPGVIAAGITTKLPLEGGSNSNVLVNDEVFDPTIQRGLVEVSSVTPGYFDAAGLALLRGRTLEKTDGANETLGVVVNRTAAERFWPDKDPLGQQIRGNSAKPWFTATVVGVVESVRQWGPEEPPQPEMYFAANRAWGRTVHLLVRSAQEATLLAPALRRELTALDPDLPLVRVRTLRQVVHEATAGQRVIAGMVNFFMSTALGLVGVGIYGTLSYHVLQRTREIGVRMALGAIRGDITSLVLRQGGAWASLGIAIGAIGAVGLTMLVRSFAYGAGAVNPLSLLAAAGTVAVATAIACLVPARRAARVDPVEALRAD